MKKKLTQAQLKELFHYNEETGTFTRLVDVGKRHKAGDVSGNLDGKGYMRIVIDGREYRAHRLAWLYAYGNWPSGEIDHINGVITDNSLINLRDVSHHLNQQNIRRAQVNNKTGLLGVRFNKCSNKYTAQIRVNGKVHHLGSFSDPETAHQYYLTEKRKLHDGCTI